MNILLTPANCHRLIAVRLPDPKSGQLEYYLHDEDTVTLFESTKYQDDYRSWFLDNNFCQQGHINMLTPIDPLFIFVPILRNFAGQQFRSIDDICCTYLESPQANGSSRLDYALSPRINWNSICDIKEVDDQSYVRFSEEKCIEWLVKKHERTMKALGVQMAADQPSRATLISYALDLIDQYLPKELTEKFKARVRAGEMTKESRNPIKGPNTTPATSKNPSDTKRRASDESIPKPAKPQDQGLFKFFKKLKK